MNPSLLEYFAAHEQLSELDWETDQKVSLIIQDLMMDEPIPVNGIKCLEFDAKWRAKLRFIRARAMHEEAMHNRPPEQIAELYEKILGKEPAQPKTTGLSFSEALVAMKEGKSARRPEWDDRYIFIQKDRIMWGNGLGECRPSHESILTDDWEIVP